eukprot:9276457-Alexandrium_andersonii.AAC.1
MAIRKLLATELDEQSLVEDMQRLSEQGHPGCKGNHQGHVCWGQSRQGHVPFDTEQAQHGPLG